MPDPTNLLRQGRDSAQTIKGAITSARRARDSFEAHWKTYQQEIKGRQRRRGKGPRRLTNYPYLFEQTFMPQLAAHRPNIWVEPELVSSDAEQAEITGLAINRIIARQKFIDQLRLCVRDAFYAFMFGKTFVYPAESGDVLGGEMGSFYGDPMWADATMCGFERISPFDALWDDSVPEFLRTAFIGHEFTRSLEAVIDDERYDPAARDQAQDSKGRMRDSVRDRYDAFDAGEIPPMVNLIELFVRPTRQIYTILETGANEFVILRKAPFVGGVLGPYHMRAYADVDEVAGMSPSCAWWDAYVQRELNEQKANDDAQAEKRVATCEDSDAESAKRFKAARPNDLVRGIKGVEEVHVGGVTEERMTWLATRDQRLELLSGVSSSRVGVAQKGKTATAEYIADSNADQGVQGKRRTVCEFVLEVCDDFKVYIHTDPNFRMQTTMPGPTGPLAEVMIRGGPQADPFTGEPVPGQSAPDMFHVKMDPRSLYMDDDQMKAAKATADAQFILGVFRPFLNSQGLDLNAVGMARELAQAANMPTLTRNLIPLSPMAMMMMQQQRQTAPSGPAIDQATNTRDLTQSQVMNAEPTQDAISAATMGAGPLRRAMTPAGANNPETSPLP